MNNSRAYKRAEEGSKVCESRSESAGKEKPGQNESKITEFFSWKTAKSFQVFPRNRKLTSHNRLSSLIQCTPLLADKIATSTIMHTSKVLFRREFEIKFT